MAKKKKIIAESTLVVPGISTNATKMPMEQLPMTEDEMRNDLEMQFEDVKTKNSALESQKIATTNQIRQLKLEILKELFDFLQKNGVDPNDLASINQFLQKLSEQDPDLVTLFELILNGLSPEGQTAPTGTGEITPTVETAGNMTGTTPPVTPGISVPPTPPTTPTTPASPTNTPPAFMERFDNLKQRGII